MKKFAAAAFLLLVIIAGVASASIPDSAGIIHACRNNSSGVVKMIDTDLGQSCTGSETAISWNQTGPQGPVGATGAIGPTGATGPVGSLNTASTQVITQEMAIASNSSEDVFANCPSGYKIVSGGYVFPHSYSFQIAIDRPKLDLSGWEIFIRVGDTAGDAHVQVYAYCAA